MDRLTYNSAESWPCYGKCCPCENALNIGNQYNIINKDDNITMKKNKQSNVVEQMFNGHRTGIKKMKGKMDIKNIWK